jgi:ATP/maltotriose-dependent transcriptional regulator MalT
VELCHLVRNIEGITLGVPPDVMPLLAQLEAELPPDVFAAAVERGKALDLDATVQELLAELSQPEPAPIPQALAEHLTRRELEVLNRVAAGRSNREIATELFLSQGTVKWYLTEIYGKLGVNGRVQAVARARELNLPS